MKNIPVPKFVSPPIEPFIKDEVVAKIKGCIEKRESRPSNQRAFPTRQPYTLGDQTVIKFILDTGLRASEFSSLWIGDVDLVTGRVVIRNGKEGGAKGRQGRIVDIGNEIRRPLMEVPQRSAGCRRSPDAAVPEQSTEVLLPEQPAAVHHQTRQEAAD
jgi:integrase/recombinase XerD